MGRIQFQGFKCERCGHTWAPRQALDSKDPVPIPKVCPKCKSAWWDVPRKEKVKPTASRKERKKDRPGTAGAA